MNSILMEGVVMEDTILYLVVPCYNEESVLPITSRMFLDNMKRWIHKKYVSDKSRILYVNDGSTDDTWSIIQSLAKRDEHFLGISQSRNRGHQSSLLAGLMEVKDVCDIAVTIDCDGQDDIRAVDEMIDKYDKGCDIVYGVRSNRDSDSWLKRNTAQAFYKLLHKVDDNTIYNHADYRLTSKRVLQALTEYREVNLYLRGLFPLIGFKSDVCYYERHQRIAGKTHYSISKMVGLAMNGLVNVGVKPLRLIVYLGMSISFFSFLVIIWVFISKFMDNTVPGWSSMLSILSLLGGIQLISLGVIGEYIGNIYMEVKDRPRYIISERTYDE